MTRLEDCCHRCHTQGCRTTVCLTDNPAARCECGVVTCDGCGHDECEAVAP